MQIKIIKINITLNNIYVIYSNLFTDNLDIEYAACMDYKQKKQFEFNYN